jgi:Fe-S-cluster containining protein
MERLESSAREPYLLSHVTSSVPAGLPQLAFRCNSCGDCCRQLRVALTHHDLWRLVRALDVEPGSLVSWLEPDEVDFAAEAASFVTLPPGPRLMVLAHDRGACRLLQEDGRCGAYAARPLDCRLYPFVLERDDERRVTRLSFFDPAGCGERDGEPASIGELARADAERATELERYAALVARWNRNAWHRARFGHRAQAEGAFFSYLAASIEQAQE